MPNSLLKLLYAYSYEFRDLTECLHTEGGGTREAMNNVVPVIDGQPKSACTDIVL